MHKRPKLTKKRKNPAFADGSLTKMLTDHAGNMMVTAALIGCTFQEKAIISSLIPSVVKSLRGVPKADVKEAVERLFPLDETAADNPRASESPHRETGEPRF